MSKWSREDYPFSNAYVLRGMREILQSQAAATGVRGWDEVYVLELLDSASLLLGERAIHEDTVEWLRRKAEKRTEPMLPGDIGI